MISLTSPAEINIGYAFLQPGEWARYKGLPVRKDVAEGMESIGLSVLRFGGCMANAADYKWKDMIGNEEKVNADYARRFNAIANKERGKQRRHRSFFPLLRIRRVAAVVTLSRYLGSAAILTIDAIRGCRKFRYNSYRPTTYTKNTCTHLLWQVLFCIVRTKNDSQLSICDRPCFMDEYRAELIKSCALCLPPIIRQNSTIFSLIYLLFPRFMLYYKASTNNYFVLHDKLTH